MALPGCCVERRAHYLTAQQLQSASEFAGLKVESGLWITHVATRDGAACGTAYFDHHVVRTFPETLMVAVTPEGTLHHIEVLVFDELLEYLPKPAWYAQFVDQKLGQELALQQHIRPVTGASLTARLHRCGASSVGGASPPRRATDTMTRSEAWCVHPATILAGGTGLVDAWFRCGVVSEGPFVVINRLWQPTTQHLHVLVAPLWVFAVGLIFRAYVGQHIQRGVQVKRRSGWVLLAMVMPMVASGYLLQTTSSEIWRRVWLIEPLISSGIWLAGDGIHQLSKLSWWRGLRAWPR